jgi:TPR repeat protein
LGARGRIFISYRRADVPGDARGVCDRLERKFGKANVFMDVDRLLAGQRFDRELDKALSQCDVLVAVIGPRWMDLLSGHVRSGERDFVHDEIAAALKRDIVVIPVLIGQEGHMPSLPQRNDLPEDIRDLVLYQKHDIAHESFNRDADRLTAAITAVLRGGRRVVPWRAIGISSAIGLTLIAVLLGYRTDMIPWIRPSAVQPRPVTDAAIVIAQSNSDTNRAAKAAEEVATKKAAEDDASRQAAEAAKRRADADAAKRRADEEAAKQKAADEEAGRKAAEEAKRQADAEAAKKKAEEEAANRKAAADCDRLAASPMDTTLPSGVAGVNNADDPGAAAACNDAMRRYPEVTRFIYQAGRVADAQKDYAKAAELYRAAAARGDSATSLAALGYLYSTGRGVAQDYVEARKWYEKAAAFGHPGAMNNLGLIYANASGVAQDYIKARSWYEKAAALGRAESMFHLGEIYELGQGVPKDSAQARLWYQKAADAGYENAKTKLKNLK